MRPAHRHASHQASKITPLVTPTGIFSGDQIDQERPQSVENWRFPDDCE